MRANLRRKEEGLEVVDAHAGYRLMGKHNCSMGKERGNNRLVDEYRCRDGLFDLWIRKKKLWEALKNLPAQRTKEKKLLARTHDT